MTRDRDRGHRRENIYLSVSRCLDQSDQEKKVLEAVTTTAAPGIVYAATRKAAEQYAVRWQCEVCGRLRTTPASRSAHGKRPSSSSWPATST